MPTQEIIEGRMMGKALWGRKRLHMLSNLALPGKYPEVAEVKRAAEYQEGWRAIDRRGMPETCHTADN